MLEEASEYIPKENSDFTTVIGYEDNPDAVSRSLNDISGKEVNLKKGDKVSSDVTIKLIKGGK